MITCRLSLQLLFQSTLPYGSDTATALAMTAHVISILAPSRERRDTVTAADLADGVFQSTLPYGSDRSFFCELSSRVWISIHAPLRERPCSKPAWLRVTQFQSTLPYGSDDITLVQIVRTLLISIHAPLRERLIRAAIEKEEEHISILAPSRERHAYVSAGVTSAEFQSSLPRGSDLMRLCCSLCNQNFNPRSLAGATLPLLLMMLLCKFQSSLPRGSDPHAKAPRGHNYISIHAPSRERQ